MMVSILMGAATSPTGIGVRMAHCQVAQESEKAMQLSSTAAKGTIWLPKAALVPTGTEGVYRLARWFKMDGFQHRFLDRASDIGAISAQ